MDAGHLPEWSTYHTGLHSKGRLLALPANISLGLNYLTLANTQAYQRTELITPVKVFITLEPEAQLITFDFLLAYEWAQ
jgi:hypothetical protein